jgi:membrane protein
VSWGSAFAAIAWLLVSLAFSWYVANFGIYNRTYGSLGAVIDFMTWIWISAIGAEMKHQTRRDATTGEERALGAQGAVKVDTVAQRETVFSVVAR